MCTLLVIGCDLKLPGERDFEVTLIGNYQLYRANPTDVGISDNGLVLVPGTVVTLVVDSEAGLIAGSREKRDVAGHPTEFFVIDTKSNQLVQSADRIEVEKFLASTGDKNLLDRAVPLDEWLELQKSMKP